MNTVDKTDQLLRMLMLAKPEQYWPIQSRVNPESATMSDFQRSRLLASLAQKYPDPTFGQLLGERFRTAGMSAESLAVELGVPAEVVEYMVNDKVHPATVPLMVMKHLLERANVTFDQARSSFQATVAQLEMSQSARPVKFGLAARKSLDSNVHRPVTSGDDITGSGEGLNQYLDRLAGFMKS